MAYQCVTRSFVCFMAPDPKLGADVAASPSIEQPQQRLPEHTPEPRDNRPKYTFAAPARVPFTFEGLFSAGWHGVKTFFHMLRHTLALFESSPRAKVEIGRSTPPGKISDSQLEICRGIADDAEARLAKLEQKSTTLLAVVAVVAPLTASAALFVVKEKLPTSVRIATLTMDMFSGIFLLLAFVAVLRALAVRGQEQLFLNTVIDPAKDEIRSYDPDFYGRGLLWVAANRQAVSDHVADFVRAAQIFLACGVICVLLAGTPMVLFIRDSPQEIDGSVRLNPGTINDFRRIAEDAQNGYWIRLPALEARLDSLLRLEHDQRIQNELSQLRKEVADLRTPPAPR